MVFFPCSEQFPPGLFLQCSIDTFALITHPSGNLCVWGNNIKLSDLTWRTRYFFFFFLVPASTYPFNSNLEISGQQQSDASTALNTVNVGPLWSIFPNSCPYSWNSFSIYVQQTLQEDSVTCKNGKLSDKLYGSVLSMYLWRPQAS